MNNFNELSDILDNYDMYYNYIDSIPYENLKNKFIKNVNPDDDLTGNFDDEITDIIDQIEECKENIDADMS